MCFLLCSGYSTRLSPQQRIHGFFIGENMNDLIKATPSQTMSSREIADLTGKEHRNVMRDIRVMLVELHGEGGLQKFQQTQINPQNGQRYPIFNLPKLEALTLLAKYKPEIVSVVAEKLDALDQILNAIRNFEVPEECADMYVYAIRNTTTGNIKLGISRNPEQRLKQLQTGNDCTLELVAYSKAENRFQDEAALHHAHAAAHIRGEWFDQSAAFAITQ